ncbi:MAG: thioredoxin domain-containing protein [Ferruginibacter sp.]
MNLHVAVNESDQKQGSSGAPLTLVEYGDYECPYCGEAYPIIKEIQAYFDDKLLFVFRNFPLAEMHPHALAAAYVAESAARQKKFWEVHDLIYENQQDLSSKQLLNYARSAGADIKKLTADINSAKIMDKVESDMESGARSGVNGTPTFFINGKRHNGNYEFEALKNALEELL